MIFGDKKTAVKAVFAKRRGWVYLIESKHRPGYKDK